MTLQGILISEIYYRIIDRTAFVGFQLWTVEVPKEAKLYWFCIPPVGPGERERHRHV